MKKTFKISRVYRMNNRMNLKTLTRSTLLAAWVMIWGISLQAQDTLTVRGRVVNPAGQPVSNVAVGVERSFELPAVTNEQGEFAVKALSGRVWLNVSPSGNYKEKRVYVNNRTDLVIYLTDDDLTSGDDELMVLSQPILKRNTTFAYSEFMW